MYTITMALRGNKGLGPNETVVTRRLKAPPLPSQLHLTHLTHLPQAIY